MGYYKPVSAENVWEYSVRTLTSPHMILIESNNILFELPKERSVTGTTWEKVKQFRVLGDGTISLACALKSSISGYTAVCDVKKNGSHVAYLNNATTSYVTKSVKLDVTSGDLIELYLHHVDSSATAYIKDVQIKCEILPLSDLID